MLNSAQVQAQVWSLCWLVVFNFCSGDSSTALFQAWNWNKVHSNVSQTMASQAKGQRQIWGQVPGTALALDLASAQAQPELSTVELWLVIL